MRRSPAQNRIGHHNQTDLPAMWCDQDEQLKYSVLSNGKLYKKDSRVWLHKSSAKIRKMKEHEELKRIEEIEVDQHQTKSNFEPDTLSNDTGGFEQVIGSFSSVENMDREVEFQSGPYCVKNAYSCMAALNLPRTLTNAELRHRRKRRNSSPSLQSHTATNRTRIGEQIFYMDENANFVGQYDMPERLARNVGFQPIREEGLDFNSMDGNHNSPSPPHNVAISHSFWHHVMVGKYSIIHLGVSSWHLHLNKRDYF